MRTKQISSFYCTSRQRSKLTRFFPTNLLSHRITPSDAVRNLDVTFDSDLNFRKQISLACRCLFYHIRDFSRIRRYIFSLSVGKSIVTALITLISTKLLCVQNCLARVVTRSPWFFHSVAPLKYLHWLPVQSRIIFKRCTIADQTPSSGETKPRELRSSGFYLLSVPRIKTHAGTRAFSVAVPTLWNSLSEHYVIKQHSLLPSPSDNSSFQTCLSLLSFLSFNCIRSFVDEFCIVP